MGEAVAPLPAHPLASIFPLMEGEAFVELVDDIARNGLHDPGVVFEGALLDGRNRQNACRQANVAFRVVAYEGSDPLAFILSKNLARRHLSTSQRALIGARLATMRSGERTDLATNDARSAVSDAKAAKLVNVSERTIERAKSVLRNASEEFVAAIERGEAAIGGKAAIVIQDTISVEHADLIIAARKGRQANVECAQSLIEAGRRLIAKKESLSRGQWLPWLEANKEALGFDARTARDLMKMAALTPNGDEAIRSALNIFEREARRAGARRARAG